MTEKLQALMHERAAATDFGVPDLASVRSAGLRRRRRQRTVAVAGGLASTAAVIGLAVAVVQLAPGGGSGPDAASDPLTTDGVSYAVGSVIHATDRTYDVGRPVRAYVATTAGYVAVDATGRVWSVTDSGVDEVGTTPEEAGLVSDPQGSYAAWLDVESSSVVALDQTDGTTESYEIQTEIAGTADNLTPGHLYALDGDTVYVRDGEDAVSIDLATGTQTVVAPSVDRGSDVIDAAGGLVAFGGGSGSGDEFQTVSLGTTRADADGPFEVSYAVGALSPDAGYFAEMRQDEGEVYDTSTGRVVELDLDGFYEAYAWADPTTVLVVAGTTPDGGGAGRLLACDVTDGSCAVAVDDLGPLEEIADTLVLPVGIA